MILLLHNGHCIHNTQFFVCLISEIIGTIFYDSRVTQLVCCGTASLWWLCKSTSLHWSLLGSSYWPGRTEGLPRRLSKASQASVDSVCWFTFLFVIFTGQIFGKHFLRRHTNYELSAPTKHEYTNPTTKFMVAWIGNVCKDLPNTASDDDNKNYSNASVRKKCF